MKTAHYFSKTIRMCIFYLISSELKQLYFPFVYFTQNRKDGFKD